MAQLTLVAEEDKPDEYFFTDLEAEIYIIQQKIKDPVVLGSIAGETKEDTKKVKIAMLNRKKLEKQLGLEKGTLQASTFMTKEIAFEKLRELGREC